MANNEIQHLPPYTYEPAGPSGTKRKGAATNVPEGMKRSSTSTGVKHLGDTGLKQFQNAFRALKKPSIKIDTDLAQRRKGVPVPAIAVKDARRQPKRVSLQPHPRRSRRVSQVNGGNNKFRQPLKLDTTRGRGEQKTGRSRSGSNLITPTIIVTPAKEDAPPLLLAVDDEAHSRRPCSSIYSRATHIPSSPEEDNVPPLPDVSWRLSSVFGQPSNRGPSSSMPRDSVVTPFEEDEKEYGFGRNERSLSSFTTFEEEDPILVRTSTGPVMTDQRTPDLLYSRSSRPIPRRSHGWWNVIHSPFPLSPDSGRTANQFHAAYSPGYGTNRKIDISEPQSATSQSPPIWINLPRRSSSFSGAIRHGSPRKMMQSQVVDRSIGFGGVAGIPLFEEGEQREVPKTGEASKYYDPNEDFGSPASSMAADRDLGGDAPEPTTPTRQKEPEDEELPIAFQGEAPRELSQLGSDEPSMPHDNGNAYPPNGPYEHHEPTTDVSSYPSSRPQVYDKAGDGFVASNPFDSLRRNDPFSSEDSDANGLDKISPVDHARVGSLGPTEPDDVGEHIPEDDLYRGCFLRHSGEGPVAKNAASSPSPIRGDQNIWSPFRQNIQTHAGEENSEPPAPTPEEHGFPSPKSQDGESFRSRSLDRGEHEVWSPLSRETESTPVVETASLGTYLPSHELQQQRNEINIPKSNSSVLPEDDLEDADRRDSVMDEEQLQTLHRLEGTRKPSFNADEIHQGPGFSIPEEDIVDIDRQYSHTGSGEVENGSNPSRNIQQSQPQENFGSSFEKRLKQDSLQEKSFDRDVNGRNRPGKTFQLFYRLRDIFSRRKWIRFWPDLAIGLGSLVLIAIIVTLVMTIPLKHNDISVQANWLNLTGFPPIPTGVSTISQPKAVSQDSSCVNPSTAWSCAVPKEDQSPFDSSMQPNFRFEIRFKNNGVTNTSSLQLVNSSSSSISRRALNPVTAGAFIRRQALAARDAFSDIMFTPTPASPPDQEQIFLGNTTDNNTTPFDGEETPFYISFLNATSLSGSEVPNSRLSRRLVESAKNVLDTTVAESFVTSTAIKARSGSQTYPFPNDASNIPAAPILADGYPAPASLLTFPQAQKLRLYNRGSSDEHYGFYTYFDRSIFLTIIGGPNASAAIPPAPQDAHGGAPAANATFRCTWSQTRFKVQIWTQKSTNLLGTSSPSSNGFPSSSNTTVKASNSSANDFTMPGSFPYPTTVTLDRHGGDASQKGVYCYALDSTGKIIRDEATWQWEDRGAGGSLVNPAVVPGNGTDSDVQKKDSNEKMYGGVDGGSGGCGCGWQNF